MPRLLYTCAYDGASFCGWQSQRGGASVQDTIETAMAQVLRMPLRIAASGRTDAGVHACRQYFHADIPDSCRMTPANWRAALNAHLPAAIRILDVKEVRRDFHARFDACGKEYEYLICRAAVLSPFMSGRAWHIPQSFDAFALGEALRAYVGTHDFRRFAAKRGNEPAVPPPDFYVRSIYAATLHEEEEMIRLRFHGNGFMYRMVRLLVGTAYQVARGKLTLVALQSMLTDPSGEKTRYCAPAEGLYLKQVFYEQ